MAKVLVLMSTYNGEKFLKEQIDSILGQEGCEIELLVRDDGSTDETITILNGYLAEGKLRWYTGENLGPGKSFMNLLINSPENYDYYAFSDQDDVWKKEKMSTAIKMIGDSSQPAIYCGNAVLVDSNLCSLGMKCNNYELKPDLLGVLVGGGIQGATMVMNLALKKKFRKSILKSNIKAHDYYVSSACLSVGGKIVYDTTPYLMYRQHGNNVVGVDKSIMGTIKKRFALMMKSDKLFGIEATSRDIIKNFDDDIGESERQLLNIAADYTKSFRNKICIIRDPGIGLGRMNIRIALSVGILLGNL